MKTKSKALLLALCAVLLVAASVLGTMAYLTSQPQSVENTFTVGKVEISLDEAQVNPYGKPATKSDEDVYTECDLADAPRVKANTYKLIPGHTYTKDPTIKVAADSEDCWLFAKIEDGLKDASTIDVKIDWTCIDKENNIYAYATKVSANASVTVFDAFTFGTTADPATFKDAKIVVTAYAVQYDGFETAKAAWEATFGLTD